MLVSFLEDLFDCVYTLVIPQGQIFLHVRLFTIKAALLLACNFTYFGGN